MLKDTKFLKSIHKNAWYIALALLILIQVLFFSYLFAKEKTSYHEDEFFSYGLSNSYYRPFMYGSEHLVFDNINTWETGDSFKNYIQTNDDTNFSYGSVWNNQIEDMHPPLYYVILHTISSMFPNQFSWWWGFSINLVAFVATQFFVFLIFRKMGKSNFAGLLVCAYWGFSIGAINNILYIRMYALQTMFTLMFVYFCSRIIHKEELSIRKDLIPIAIVVFLGAMTQHTFLVFAFIYTLLQCIYYLCKRKFKNMFKFGLLAAVGVLLSFAAFFATFEHLFGNPTNDGVKFDILVQVHLLLRLFIRDTLGFLINFFIGNTMLYVRIIAITLIVISCTICFLFRKDIWFKNLRAKIINTLKTADYTWLIIMITVFGFIFILSLTFNYLSFQEYSNRYMFVLMPLFCGVLIAIPLRCVSFIKKLTIKRIGIVLVTLVFASLTFNQFYNNRIDMYIMKDNAENGKINEYVKDADCIMLMSKAIFLPCYPQMMENADDIYITFNSKQEFKTQESEYKRIFDKDKEEFYILIDVGGLVSSIKNNFNNNKENGVIYDDSYIDNYEDLIKESTSEEDIIEYFETISGYESEYCTKENTHFCTAKLYKFTKK